MDSNVLAFPLEISVGEARRRARRRSRRPGNYLYVVDAGRKLVGAVSLSELMSASPSAGLASLMSSNVLRLPAHASGSMILNHAGWRELHAIPVVDSEGVLVGVLRRETCERLRTEQSGQGAGSSGGPGMSMVELGWAAVLSTIDELARGMSLERAERHSEVSDDD